MKPVFFVTGGTGVLGSALVPVLVKDAGAGARLLVRARDLRELAEKKARLFSLWGAAVPADRVQFLIGDATQERLGLSEEDFRAIAADTTHVVHAAASVKLNGTLAEARVSAVQATREAVRLARACPGLQKMEYVSTVGVGGRRAEPLPETRVGGVRSFRNTYEEAKAEAEALVLKEIENGLPASIHRPSMIIGASDTGRIAAFQVFYHLLEFLSGRRTAGFLPDMAGRKLDTIPVDFAARAIAASAMDRSAAGRIFHLCSGPSDSLTLGEIAQRYRCFLRERGDTVPSLRRAPGALFQALANAAGVLPAPARLRRQLRTVPYFLDYLEGNLDFRNEESDRYFLRRSVARPAPANHLERVLWFHWSSQQRSDYRFLLPVDLEPVPHAL